MSTLCPHSLSVGGCRLGSLCNLTHVVTDVAENVSQCTSSSLHGSTLGKGTVLPLWWWCEKTSCFTRQRNHWRLVPRTECQKLEDSYQAEQAFCIVRSHRVDFKSSTMSHLSCRSHLPESSRMIERVTCLISPTWYTLSPDGTQAVQFNEEVCALLESEYCKGLKTRITLRVGLRGLFVNLGLMEVRDPSTNTTMSLRRQAVRLNCANVKRSFNLVDEYGAPLYIFDAADRAPGINPNRCIVEPHGVLQTNEITRLAVAMRCPVSKCRKWQKDIGHMLAMQHACPRGKFCQLAELDASTPIDAARKVWSDTHCSLFHHDVAIGTTLEEDDIFLQWKQNQTFAKQFKSHWVGQKAVFIRRSNE